MSLSESISIVKSEDVVEQVKRDLKEVNSIADPLKKTNRYKEIAKACMNAKQWDLALNVIKFISDDKTRNLMIADLVEEYLLPAREYEKVKNCIKFLIPEYESTTLVLIRFSLVEGNREEALRWVDELPTPQSRNYALCHIAESYLVDNEKDGAIEIGKMMIENARLISDPEQQNFALRDISKNVFLAMGEKELARKAAEHISNEELKSKTLRNIDSA